MRSMDVCSGDRPLAMLQAGLAGLAGRDVAGLSDARVHDVVAALLVCVNQLDAVLADRLGSFDTRGLSDSDAVRTTLSWLRIYGRMSAPTASQMLRRARLLRDLPALAAAARAGSVSSEQANSNLSRSSSYGSTPTSTRTASPQTPTAACSTPRAAPPSPPRSTP